MKKCVFLDKDGTLIKDVPYNVDLTKITIYPEIFRPLRELQRQGFIFIIISNQSGIARGYFNNQETKKAFDHLLAQCLLQGIHFAGYYYCPHDSSDINACECRKPKPGLLFLAAQHHEIDLSRSWMVGDIASDVLAGKAAGCRTILIDRDGSEIKKLSQALNTMPNCILPDFEQLDEVILQKNKYHEQVY